MIVHRDYAHSGASSIKIYNDKIEFYNAGKLPDAITIEKLLTSDYVSEIRNIKIAGMFKQLKLIEKYGSGFSRIIKAFKVYNLKMPIFENFQSGFRITVFAEKTNVVANDPVNGRLKLILVLIKENRHITRDELAIKCNISIETIKRDIRKLRKQEIIKRIGSDKTGYWEIIIK